MINEITSYIRNNGGTPWRALQILSRSAIKSDFIQKVTETFATRIVLIGIGLITGVIVARILGPEGRGLYAIAMTVATTGVQFGNLGLHASNTYFVAKDRALLPALVGNTFFVSFVIGGLGVSLAWILFSQWPNLAPIHGPLLVLALIWIPLGLAYMLMQNILLGIQEVRAYNKIELVMQLVSVALIGVVIIAHLVTVEIVFLMGYVTVVVSAIWAFWRIKPHLSQQPSLSLFLFKNNIQYGIKAYLAAFFAFLVLRADLLLVKYILDAEQAGYYSIAVNMADMIFMLPTVVATILFPKLSAMHNKIDKWNYSKRVISIAGLLLIFIAGLSALYAGAIIRLLFGNVYSPAVPAFVWLIPGILFLGFQAIAVQFLNSEGFPKIIVVVWGLALLINVGLNIYAIPKYGIIGASVVASISYFIVFLFVMLIIRRVIHE
jgi:antigen flippase